VLQFGIADGFIYCRFQRQFGIADRFIYCSLQWQFGIADLFILHVTLAVCYSGPLYVLQLTMLQFGIGEPIIY
jgi:hypothetical protein